MACNGLEFRLPGRIGIATPSCMNPILAPSCFLQRFT